MTAGLPRSRMECALARTPPLPAEAQVLRRPGRARFRFGEVMTATPNFASDALAGIGAGDTPAPVASTGPFVLNLCSSTTPMALAQTDLPELKRFTFFVSRRFEEGRERFRLHMGYFATLAEAEEWLNVVREIYPGAWAGEAPGKKLRERAAAAAAAQAQHAAGPQEPVSAPAPVRAPVAKVAAPPMAIDVPVLHAAPQAPVPVPVLIAPTVRACETCARGSGSRGRRPQTNTCDCAQACAGDSSGRSRGHKAARGPPGPGKAGTGGCSRRQGRACRRGRPAWAGAGIRSTPGCRCEAATVQCVR